MSSYVVTGAGRGVGRAVVERLIAGEGHVVAVDFDSAALQWVDTHPAADQRCVVRTNVVGHDGTGAYCMPTDMRSRELCLG
jgi:NAD(P)-dependent dehydrogenase (short-subunit alcohol dehydrogenase family)